MKLRKNYSNTIIAGLKCIKYAGQRHNQTVFEFQCFCGKPFIATVTRVRNGYVKSCGCRKQEILASIKLLRWKGGKFKTSRGYIYILNPQHPNANSNGYVSEHVLIASEIIKRPIKKHEVVHHINGIKHDNRPENLEVMTRSIHNSHHHKGLIKPNSILNLSKHGGTRKSALKAWITRRSKIKARL